MVLIVRWSYLGCKWSLRQVLLYHWCEVLGLNVNQKFYPYAADSNYQNSCVWTSGSMPEAEECTTPLGAWSIEVKICVGVNLQRSNAALVTVLTIVSVSFYGMGYL